MLSIDYSCDRVNRKVCPELCGRASPHECVQDGIRTVDQDCCRESRTRWLKLGRATDGCALFGDTFTGLVV